MTSENMTEQHTAKLLSIDPLAFNKDKINYLLYQNERRDKIHEIERRDITAEIFSYGFYEVIDNAKYIRLYFDIDHLGSLNEYNDFIANFLNPLASKFNSKFALGGYSNNKEIAAATGLRYQEKANKTISVHIVFYEIAFLTNDLITFINNYELNDLIDSNVYHLHGQQCFRHVLSDKFPTKTKKEQKAGNIVKGDYLNMLLTPSGEERLITINDIDRLFQHKQQTKPKAKKSTTKQEAKITLEDFEQADKEQECLDKIANNGHLINLSADSVIELLIDNIDPGYENTVHILSLLCHSPYAINEVEDIAASWYQSRSHKTTFDINGYIHKYYDFEDSDKWIYSILNLFDESTKQQLTEQYKIYKSVNINNGTITMDKVVRRKYKDTKTLITDLKSCVGIVDNKIYIKKNYRQRNGTYKMKLTELTHEEFNNTYNLIHPFRSMKLKDLDDEKQDEATLNKLKRMTLKDVINANSDKFIYNNIKKTKNNITDVINEFAGLPYKPLPGTDLIQPFLEHIKAVICENDYVKFDYVIKWFANIIQNIYVKNGTMLIFYGSKGCGKSIFTDVMAELLGDIATPSVCDMGKIFGKFNDFLTKKVYININEAPDYDKKKAMTQTIKETITSTYLAVEGKGKSVKDGEQFANFTITTNFDDPVEVEIGDRRLAFFHCSNCFVGNSEYFNNLMKNIKGRYDNNYNPEFMGQLYNYMLDVDISNFNAADYVIKLNNDYNNINNENLERQYYNSNDLIRYLCDNVESFTRGISLDEILRTLTNYSKNGLGKKLKNYCDYKSISQKDYNKIYNIDNPYNQSTAKQYYYFFKEHPDDIESLIKWKANTMDIVYDYNMVKANYKLIDEYFDNEKAEKEEQKQAKQQAKAEAQQQKQAELNKLEEDIKAALNNYEFTELIGFNLKSNDVKTILSNIAESARKKVNGKEIRLYKLKQGLDDDDIFEEI